MERDEKERRRLTHHVAKRRPGIILLKCQPRFRLTDFFVSLVGAGFVFILTAICREAIDGGVAIPSSRAPLARASAVDAFGGIRQSLQPRRCNQLVAGIAAAVAPLTNAVQSAFDLRQLTRFEAGHLRTELALLRGDGCIDFVADRLLMVRA